MLAASILHSNLKSSATDTLSLLAILSSVSKDGALTPRSTRLRKSTEMSILSATLHAYDRLCQDCMPPNTRGVFMDRLVHSFADSYSKTLIDEHQAEAREYFLGKLDERQTHFAKALTNCRDVYSALSGSVGFTDTKMCNLSPRTTEDGLKKYSVPWHLLPPYLYCRYCRSMRVASEQKAKMLDLVQWLRLANVGFGVPH
jgi:hypothetical protein